MLDNRKCQTNSAATNPILRRTDFSFSLKDLEVAIERLHQGTGFDSVHTSHIKSSKLCYLNLLCKFLDKLVSRTYISHSMVKGHTHLTVKTSSVNKIDSKNYRPVMNSSNFLKVIEYILLPHLGKDLPIDQNQFAHRPTTGCVEAFTVIK